MRRIMKKNDPESRLKDLVSEMSDLQSIETEATLQKEMSFRKAIEKAIPSGIAVMDDTGKQVYINKAFCEMVGYDVVELQGKRPPYAYWPQQDMENINNAMKLTLENNTPKQGFDLIFCHKTGKLIPVQVFIIPFIQDDGKVFFLANVIDITERKKTEEALIKSQLLLKSSIESQKDTIIFFVDLDYHYLYFNIAHLEAMKFAYNTNVKEGTNFLDCITSPSDRKLIKENLDRAIKGESTSQIHKYGDSNLGYYETFFNPVRDESNEIIGCTCLARNITERIEAEKTLLESETKFREIINQSNDGIIVFDEQGKIVVWNKGAEQISGLKADAILNQNIVDVRYQVGTPKSRDKSLIENEIKDIINFKKPEVFKHLIEDEIMPSNSKSLKNIQTKIFPIKLIGYKLFCMIFRDATETKRYEKELLKINTEKDKFYSMIAQYLYTPFNSFHNFTKLMAEELDTLPIKEIQKTAAMMSKSASNLYSLLDNLLQWTQVNQGKIAFEPEKLDFLKISHDAVSILKPNAEAKDIKINHLVKDEIPVFADPFMIKTVLRNLVSNSIKFTNTGGEINISAQQSPSDITISISDNRTELAPDYINNLFNTSQVNAALGRAAEKGNTLGLLLCKEFVEKHSGKIWAVNGNGRGCEIKFTLPFYT
jgi:PAS domain S-box-containing protein